MPRCWGRKGGLGREEGHKQGRRSPEESRRPRARAAWAAHLEVEQAVLLEVEVLQADQAAEDVAGQAAELAAVQMQRLQPLQALERVGLQRAQVPVVPEVQLLQGLQVAEGARVDGGEVVGEEPQGEQVGPEGAGPQRADEVILEEESLGAGRQGQWHGGEVVGLAAHGGRGRIASTEHGAAGGCWGQGQKHQQEAGGGGTCRERRGGRSGRAARPSVQRAGQGPGACPPTPPARSLALLRRGLLGASTVGAARGPGHLRFLRLPVDYNLKCQEDTGESTVICSKLSHESWPFRSCFHSGRFDHVNFWLLNLSTESWAGGSLLWGAVLCDVLFRVFSSI